MNKRSVTPPRPPPPKLGGGGGISFSFKALEEEDDEELTIVTGKFDKQVHDERERQLKEHERERSLSKSPETRGFGEVDKSPILKSQKSYDKLLGKIQDTISKKIEEFASDSQKKDKPAESGRGSVSDSDFADAVEAESVNLEDKGDEGLDVDTEFFSVKSDDNTSSTQELDEECLEMNDEYYSPNGEDLASVPTLRQRKTFQKFRKIKPIVPPSPITMSKLSGKQPDILSQSEVKTSPQFEAEKSSVKSASGRETVITVHGAKVPVKKLVGSVVFIFLYMLIPLPSYIKGMIVGVILSSFGWMVYIWVNEPPKPKEPIPEEVPLDQLPPMPVPEMKEAKGENFCYKGWMNEVMEYTPETYSINHTHSVYVHLENTTLRLRRPKVNIPKRAMWDEPTPTPQFVHQRHFDIEGSKVLLLPNGLVTKRLWSKKYPICIALAKDGKKHSVKHDVSLCAGNQTGGGSGIQTPGRMSASSSVDSAQGFELINEQKCDSSVLYLFSRTCHEKERWFKRLTAAAKGQPLKNHMLEIRRILSICNSSMHRRSSSTDSLKTKRQGSSDSLSSAGTVSPTQENIPSQESDLINFVMYISRLVPRERESSLPSSPAHLAGSKDKPENKVFETKVGSIPRGIICDPVLLSLNALIGRCFWDFLKDRYWAEKVQDKLQKKLSKIHIPYFIEELKITEIDLGTEVPVIRRTNKPYLDEDGFWVDLDVTYSGKFKMTIETKVNLMKLKQPQVPKSTDEVAQEKRSAVIDSEEEDSAESSTDEEEEMEDERNYQASGTGKKIMKYITKITASKYFQSAAENKYIKKAMTEVSNTRLVLTVEMQKLNGTLAINIPPPPTDRFWYGFRTNPQLWLVAKPKVGEREVTMSHVTEWIEKKLTQEFQHVLVMPNMDDLVIPILLPGTETEVHTGNTESEV